MYQHRIELAHRHLGYHNTHKECVVQVEEPLVRQPGSNDVSVDEERLLKALPKGFLPRGIHVNKILLMTMDPNGCGGTAVRDPIQFRSWGKYFDAYSLTVGVAESLSVKNPTKTTKATKAPAKKRPETTKTAKAAKKAAKKATKKTSAMVKKTTPAARRKTATA